MDELTKKVFEKIDELSGKYLEVLMDACNIESKSEDKAGVDKVGAYFADLAGSLGYTIRKREFARAGNVYSLVMRRSVPACPRESPWNLWWRKQKGALPF